MRNSLLLGNLALGVAALLIAGTGCFGHAEAGAYTEVDAPVVFEEEPTLVVVEPNVWVVRDYDYAVYYVDGYYWVYRDGWRRSRAYDRGWMTVEVNIVPRIIVSRDHHAYVHYHGPSNAPIRRAPRERDLGPNDHDRPGRPDDRRAAPPRRDNDNVPRPPQHEAPRPPDRRELPRPPQHAEPPRPPRHAEPPRPPQHEAPRPPDRRELPRPPQHEAPRPPDRREVPRDHGARPDVNPREQRPRGNERRDDNRPGNRRDERKR